MNNGSHCIAALRTFLPFFFSRHRVLFAFSRRPHCRGLEEFYGIFHPW